jgi:hypothetical protein
MSAVTYFFIFLCSFAIFHSFHGELSGCGLLGRSTCAVFPLGVCSTGGSSLVVITRIKTVTIAMRKRTVIINEAGEGNLFMVILYHEFNNRPHNIYPDAVNKYDRYGEHYGNGYEELASFDSHGIRGELVNNGYLF